MFGCHDREEIGPRRLAKIAEHTGLKPDHLESGRFAWQAHGAVHHDIGNL
jgi:hypothetical protein